MSRGLGELQRRILATLALYESHGASLEWDWRAAGAGKRALELWNESDKAAYEAGRRVETWKLLRDTGASKTSLARALRTLERRGMVIRWRAPLVDCDRASQKAAFATLTRDGRDWLSANTCTAQLLAIIAESGR